MRTIKDYKTAGEAKPSNSKFMQKKKMMREAKVAVSQIKKKQKDALIMDNLFPELTS